jgi:hypothetical protein
VCVCVCVCSHGKVVVYLCVDHPSRLIFQLSGCSPCCLHEGAHSWVLQIRFDEYTLSVHSFNQWDIDWFIPLIFPDEGAQLCSLQTRIMHICTKSIKPSILHPYIHPSVQPSIHLIIHVWQRTATTLFGKPLSSIHKITFNLWVDDWIFIRTHKVRANKTWALHTTLRLNVVLGIKGEMWCLEYNINLNNIVI